MARTSKTSGSKRSTKTRSEPAAKKTETTNAPATAEATEPRRFSAKERKAGAGVKLNPNRLLAELVGTFIFTLVVVAALSGKFTLSFFTTPEVAAQALQAGQTIPSFTLTPFVAGIALVALVLATHKVSGGYLNPAITVGQMVLRRMRVVEGVGYIIAQLLGSMLALSIATQLISVVDPASGTATSLSPDSIFSHAASWQIFSAELLGSFVFGFMAAAAFAYRALPRAILYGTAFVVGLGVALMANTGVLNPALAVGVGLIGFGGENLWALAGIYLGGTTLGVLIGMAFHALLSRGNALQEAKR